MEKIVISSRFNTPIGVDDPYKYSFFCYDLLEHYRGIGSNYCPRNSFSPYFSTGHNLKYFEEDLLFKIQRYENGIVEFRETNLENAKKYNWIINTRLCIFAAFYSDKDRSESFFNSHSKFGDLLVGQNSELQSAICGVFFQLCDSIINHSNFSFIIHGTQFYENLLHAYAINHALKFSMNFWKEISAHITPSQYRYLFEVIEVCDNERKRTLNKTNAFVEIQAILHLFIMKHKVYESNIATLFRIQKYAEMSKYSLDGDKELEEKILFFHSLIDEENEFQHIINHVAMLKDAFDPTSDDSTTKHLDEEIVACFPLLKKFRDANVDKIHSVLNNERWIEEFNKFM